MKKKELKSIPIAKANMEVMHDIAVSGKGKRGVITVQNVKNGAEEVLVLNVYQTSGRNKRDISLLFRVFCQKEDYITLEVECNKWRTAALLNLVCRDAGWAAYWWNYEQLEFLTAADARKAENVYRKWLEDKENHTNQTAFELLHRYQENIKAIRLAKKHKKETDIIDLEMEKFGNLPDDYQIFVEERVFKDENYIFYNTKKKSAFCTSCKKNFILENKHLRHKTIAVWNNRDEVKHNRIVRCPYCNKYLQAKSTGMGRSSLKSVAWSVLIQSKGEDVLTRYFCHIKDFRADFNNPKITSYEGYRTVHKKEGSTDYMWGRYKNTEMRWCYYKDRSYGWYPPSETVYPRNVVMYNKNLSDVLTGTCMQCSALDIFINNVANDPRYFNTPWLIDNYFRSYRKYPFIEQLLKVGFYRMTREFLEDNRVNAIEFNASQRTVLGTLGIGKIQYNMLRKLEDPAIRDLEILRYKPDLKWEEFNDLRYIRDNGHIDMYKKYIDLMAYTTLHKITRYISEQKLTTRDNDYFDYTGWLEEMGYDMRNEFNLFPKDFQKTHDSMSKLYIKFKDEQSREEAKKFNLLLKKLRKDTVDVEAMNLNIEGLFIRLPNRLEELKVEGETLHHCVGTYMEKVRRGETMIFFIRKKEEPDKPYYTLEWRGKVIQCRGSHNCNMTSEVKAFVQIFQEKMMEYESKPKRQRKAG